jgi:heme/copper-type cytochrome/quinol oxidase subunit 3
MNLVTSREAGLRLAMWSVIASEGVLFASLLAMRGGPRLLPPSPALVAACAIAISLGLGARALSIAIQRVRSGQTVAAERLVGAGCLLAVVALGLELASVRLFGARDTVGMLVIGLHTAHVAAAVSLATWTLALLRSGRVTRRHHDVLCVVRSFWYFVAALWIFVWPLFTAPRS